MRLQKYLADCGVASRRKAEEWIARGEVAVNGEVRREMGISIEPGQDVVTVRGQIVTPPSRRLYLALHKPCGIITSTADQFGRRTVLDLIPLSERLFPIGRLDYDTSGLLLLTNDGEFAHHIMHPKYDCPKTYRAVIPGRLSPSQLDALRQGMDIGGEYSSPAQVEVEQETAGRSVVRLTIHEGKNRQVRRMLQKAGHPAISLCRIAVGQVVLGDLPEGEWRHLTAEEIDSLRGV